MITKHNVSISAIAKGARYDAKCESFGVALKEAKHTGLVFSTDEGGVLFSMAEIEVELDKVRPKRKAGGKR